VHLHPVSSFQNNVVRNSNKRMAAGAAIEALGLTKRYADVVAVDDLTFRVREGSVTGFLGPNGAGKTTTLRMVLGLARPSAGEATIAGRRYVDLDDPVRTVGANLEIAGAHPGRSGRNHLLALAVMAGLPRSRVDEVLRLVELDAAADRRAGKYSLGMRQRLGVARSLLTDPELLILDEPSTGLDPQARHMIWERLRSLLSRGKTILLTTHFMEEAERLCDRLCVIEEGRKIAEGRPHELIESVIGCDVIEIYGPDPLALRDELAPFVGRMEVSGETLFCYVDDPQAVHQRVKGRAGVRYLHRPANLEDVFLRLTGREMVD
jgi:lipooligosaccharide transport system ATP-binding protein